HFVELIAPGYAPIVVTTLTRDLVTAHLRRQTLAGLS
ncbi:unnamed protein product, partial [marine sediment metagenome]